MKKLLEIFNDKEKLDKIQKFFTDKHLKIEDINIEKAKHRKPGDVVFYVKKLHFFQIMESLKTTL